MTTASWQIKEPLSAIVFDCDGTLSSLEGIVELAKMQGVETTVAALTTTAMESTGLNPTLYQQRLELVRPNKQHILQLGRQYTQTIVPDAKAVISLLARLNKTIYIASAGIKLAVEALATELHIAHDHVFAVEVFFDAAGDYQDFDHHSPLIDNNGKKIIVQQLQQQHPRLAHIGDGLNDCSIKSIATRFIGYGGVFQREKVRLCCDYYVNATSFTALLPLLLTIEESQALHDQDAMLYQQGLRL